ncbi:srpk [Aspergillus luchuensis]|uniref:Srpk n=1 Tax=Aspergillus kawachii TaxID=1069201 RepID=A0A146FG44_ASPKA|nr:srpk [Aspergillus luchuensis]
MSGDNFADQSFNLFAVRKITLDHLTTPTKPFYGWLGVGDFCRALDEDYVCAMLSEPEGDCLADSSGAAGD